MPPAEPPRAVVTQQTARQRVRIHVPCVDCTEPNGMHWFWSAASGSGQWTPVDCHVLPCAVVAMASATALHAAQRAVDTALSRRSKHGCVRATLHKPGALMAAGGGGGGTPRSPGVATPGMLREVLRKLRGDMMDAEAHVPWSAVRPQCQNNAAESL